MKVFVGYGFHARDKWVEKLVFPLIEAFGSEVESGRAVYGGSISAIIKERIRDSDALMGFTTKRDTRSRADGITHRWVTDELAAASMDGKKIVEIREVGVTRQGGITCENQRIVYSEKARELCLVEIVKMLGDWHRDEFVQIQLLPEPVANGDLRPLLDRGLTCEYVIKRGNREVRPCPVVIDRIKGGLFITIPKPDRNALVKIDLRHDIRRWSSDYESVNSYGIHLR